MDTEYSLFEYLCSMMHISFQSSIQNCAYKHGSELVTVCVCVCVCVCV